ncbi:Charged multivesicular body protein 1b, partial [Trichinella britovi]
LLYGILYYDSLLKGNVKVLYSVEMSAVIENHLFNLKFASKELLRNAKKCDKEEKQEKTKLRNAIQKGNLECAQIHAENAIRKKNEGLNYMRMSSRIDAVAARVQTALTTKKVSKSMAGVVKAMDAAMRSMNLEKTSQLMDKFETEFVNLDVQSATMENAMSATSTLNAPQNEVDKLMQQVADEAGLELNMQLPSGQMSTIVGTSKNSAEQDELSQRLAKLRQI